MSEPYNCTRRLLFQASAPLVFSPTTASSTLPALSVCKCSQTIVPFNVSHVRSSTECFGIHLGAPQSANLGDGNGFVNQTVELRQDFGSSSVGTCLESLVGGNHFRYAHMSFLLNRGRYKSHFISGCSARTALPLIAVPSFLRTCFKCFHVRQALRAVLDQCF